MAFTIEELAAQLARLEAQHGALSNSMNRHEDSLDEIWANIERVRRERDEAVDKINEALGELKTRIFGVAVAIGIIVVLANLVGTAVAIYAAIK